MELGVTLTVDGYNPDVGDLRLNAAGDEVVLSDLGSEVAQRLTVSFKFFQGEWFLELSEGTPYYAHILGKGPKEAVIRAIVSRILLATEGVAEVLNVSYLLDPSTRTLALDFACRLEDGSVFRATEFGEYLVAV